MDKIVLLFALSAILFASAIAEKLLVCYHGSWSTYRQGNGKCGPKDLDPFMCTHLIYTFVGLNEDATIRIMDPWLELPDNWGRDNFGQFNNLKKINPKLKTIIAIGGWNEGSRKYSKVANDPNLRAKFAVNAAEFTIKYGFDGFDMDWEYPGQRDSPLTTEDIVAHAKLLAAMRQEFDKHGLLLTAAVASVEKSASQSYDIPTISQYLDIINVMAYDLHGAWDPVTGHNAALQRYEMDVEPKDSFDVKTSLEYWIAQGAPKEKLIMGLPLYGRTFNLANPMNATVGAPTNGAGLAGQYSREKGMIGLNELCEKRLTEKWVEQWDAVAQVPYTVNERDWITYDDEKSLRLKSELAMSMGLGGVMVWSVETDDFNGICGKGTFPYLREINRAIGREIGTAPSTTTSEPGTGETTVTTPSTTTSKPGTGETTITTPSTTTSKPGTGETTVTTPSTTTTNKPGCVDPNALCAKEGYIRDPTDCSVYYLCVMEGPVMKPYRFFCANGLYFDDIKLLCNYAELVDCNAKPCE